MSNDGARAAFVGAFFEVAAPKVKKVSADIEVLYWKSVGDIKSQLHVAVLQCFVPLSMEGWGWQ